jgi:signal transduction histidine kinase
MKLVWRLTLYLMLVMCVVLIVDGVVAVQREKNRYNKELKEDLLQTAQSTADASLSEWQRIQARFAHKTSKLVDRPSRTQQMRWVRLDAAAGDFRTPRVPPTQLRPVLDGHPVQLVQEGPDGAKWMYTYLPVNFPRSRHSTNSSHHRRRSHSSARRDTTQFFLMGSIGVLEISQSLAPEERYIHTLIVDRVITASVLALAFGSLFVGRPMRALVAKARKIGHGDLSGPLDVRQNDEIGVLAAEINNMCTRLAEADTRVSEETAARMTAINQLRHADRLAMVGTLASGIAHELGTPLNVVQQRAKMLASGHVSEETVADNARIIAEQSQHMISIIRQLLDFARPVIREKTVFHLEQTVQHSIDLLTPLLQSKGITCTVIADGSPFLCEGVEVRVQQAITNLIVNGIQAMPEGGSLTVEIARVRETPPADLGAAAGLYLRLAVRDQGLGISETDLPHIFEPFYSTKSVGEGTGLGLSVAYGIIREHGGWIAVESTVGQGSRFAIYLPEAVTA